MAYEMRAEKNWDEYKYEEEKKYKYSLLSHQKFIVMFVGVVLAVLVLGSISLTRLYYFRHDKETNESIGYGIIQRALAEREKVRNQQHQNSDCIECEEKKLDQRCAILDCEQDPVGCAQLLNVDVTKFR